MFPVWLLGALLAMVPAPRFGPIVRWIVAIIYLPLVFLFSRAIFWSPLVSDYLFAGISGLFLWALLSARGKANKAEYFTRVSRWLSSFSYTLYIVHLPLLLLGVSVLMGTERWLPDAKHLAEGWGLFAVVVAYSYGVAALTEYRTERVRQWIERGLGLAEPANVPDAAPVKVELAI